MRNHPSRICLIKNIFRVVNLGRRLCLQLFAVVDFLVGGLQDSSNQDWTAGTQSSGGSLRTGRWPRRTHKEAQTFLRAPCIYLGGASYLFRGCPMLLGWISAEFSVQINLCSAWGVLCARSERWELEFPHCLHWMFMFGITILWY